MAYIYDHIHDDISVSGILNRISGWNSLGLLLMDIQLILCLVLGLYACLYMVKKIGTQFQKSDQNPTCGECNAEEAIKKIDK